MQPEEGVQPVEQSGVGHTFEIVVVCTGNRARSPVTEAALRTLLADLPVRVSSLGTLDIGSLPPLREAVAAAATRGVDIRDHRSRCLRAERLDRVDLVVGFERHHLTAAIDECRASPECVFSMPELVELLEAIEPPSLTGPVAGARDAVARAHALRIANPKPPRELRDPLGGSPRVYRETVARILNLSVRLATGLFGAAGVRAPSFVASWRSPVPRERSRLGDPHA
jgi:protein-tyrosine-phosphatase